MSRYFGLSLFALGVVLLILGLGEIRVLSARLQDVLGAGSGASSAWLAAFGVISVAAGLWLAWKNLPRH